MDNEVKASNEPTIFAIFGGAGDLSWRKLVPSLFNLHHDQRLPEKFAIIAIDRDAYDDVKLKAHLHDGVNQFSRLGKASATIWNSFAKNIYYIQGDFKKVKTYEDVRDQCQKLEKAWGTKPHQIFYMATPPSLFTEIPTFLKKVGLSADVNRDRLVIEKPFGYDLGTAVALNAALLRNFTEQQIFRIDHYLGKETVQNILAFRFANPLFEPIWNRRYVDFVSITVAEDVGIEHRGSYYDHAGALRDMIQNHLMQLLCLVAMEPMASLSADEIRNKNIDVLKAIRPIKEDNISNSVVRGQYAAGFIKGQAVPGYREEEGVAKDSQTETYVALKLYLDNWRWQDVPFYLRTGKRLSERATEIVIQFKPVPHQCFPIEASFDWKPSRIILSIQPHEGIKLRFQAKRPGLKMNLKSVFMNFNYQDSFSTPVIDAYETLLWDVMNNDQTLFKRADQVEEAWKVVMPIINIWSSGVPSDFPNYESGTWGPECANALLAHEGHSWPYPQE